MNENLGAWLEGVGADREDGVLALLMLAQLGPKPGQQDAQPEGLGHVIVGTRIESEDRVRVRARRGQHDDRRLNAAAPHQTTDLSAIHIRQTDIEDYGVVIVGLGQVQAFGAGFGKKSLELLMKTKLLAERLAQRVIVVDQEYLFSSQRAHGLVSSLS